MNPVTPPTFSSVNASRYFKIPRLDGLVPTSNNIHI